MRIGRSKCARVQVSIGLRRSVCRKASGRICSSRGRGAGGTTRGIIGAKAAGSSMWRVMAQI